MFDTIMMLFTVRCYTICVRYAFRLLLAGKFTLGFCVYFAQFSHFTRAHSAQARIDHKLRIHKVAYKISKDK